MERWERERILGEWGVRDGTVRSQAERRALEEDLGGSPLRGKPLRRRYRNFRPDPAGYLMSLGGPLPYMVRLREIHELTRLHERELERAWVRLAAECSGNRRRFERRWRELAGRWNFVAVNALIEAHNRNFPVESRLPMDPRTGDFALVAGEPYRKPLLDAGWVLERFPPELERVAA